MRSPDRIADQAFIAALMARMTLEEKVGQLNLLTPGEGSLTGSIINADVAAKVRRGEVGGIFGLRSLPRIRAFQEQAVKTRLGIPLLFAEDVIHGHRTIFPIPLGLACTFDPALIEQAARVAAVEASAEGIDQVYAPMIDIARDPRWGRIAESPGEDPHLASEYAAACVRGFQTDDLSRPDAVLACIKHFVGYGAAEGGLDYDLASLDPKVLHNVYLPPFLAALEAGAGSAMVAFHALNGEPMHAHATLIRQVLRHAGDVLVVADYTGVQELVAHRVAETGADAAALALAAGVDMDMVSELYLQTLPQAVRDGRVAPALVDEACRHVLEAKQKLGLFADPFRRMSAQPVALAPAHRQLARRLAADACVLLKNAGSVLPLQRHGRIALVGPLADDTVNMPGTWAVAADPAACISVLAGMRAVAGVGVEITHAKGANIVDCAMLADRLNVHNRSTLSVTTDGRPAQAMIDEAVALARAADVIVAVVGEAKEHSGESSSRMALDIPQEQQQVLLRALKATARPLVIVVMSGRPLVLRDELAMADALLLAWFGGTEAGHGLADLLFGDVDPSGRLAVSLPFHVGQLPVYAAHDSGGRPFGSDFEKFKKGYLDAPAGVHPHSGLLPFGFGLSYSHFSHGAPSARLSPEGDEIFVQTCVTNTGRRPGSEVVQLYVTDDVARFTRPVRELKRFTKIALLPGERREICFTLRREDMAFSVAETIADMRRIWEEGSFAFATGPNAQELQTTRLFWPARPGQRTIEYSMSGG